MDRKEYLDTLAEQIRSKPAAAAVRREIESHIEEQKKAFLAEGMTGPEAEEAAVQEMGDPVETGVAMDLIHRPQIPWGSVVLIVFLSIVGMVFRFSLMTKLPGVSFMTGDVTREGLYLCLGLALMIGICLIDYSRIGRRARTCSLVLALVLMAGNLFAGIVVNGMSGYLYFAGRVVSINLVWPLFVPLYGGIIYRYRKGGYQGLAACLLWTLPGVICTMSCSRMGAALLLLEIDLIILIVAVWKQWFQVAKKKTLIGSGAALILLPVASAGITLLFGADYQKMRLMTLFDVSGQEGNWMRQTIQDMLGNSRFIGASQQALDQEGGFPAVDFVLSYIVGYYGILAALVLIGLILYLMFRLLRVSLRQKNQLGRLMGTGCAIVMVAQILIYVLCNMGIILPGTIYCPFLTSGGTVMLVTYIIFGILLSVYRYQDIPLEEGGRVSSVTP